MKTNRLNGLYSRTCFWKYVWVTILWWWSLVWIHSLSLMYSLLWLWDNKTVVISRSRNNKQNTIKAGSCVSELYMWHLLMTLYISIDMECCQHIPSLNRNFLGSSVFSCLTWSLCFERGKHPNFQNGMWALACKILSYIKNILIQLSRQVLAHIREFIEMIFSIIIVNSTCMYIPWYCRLKTQPRNI